MDLQQFSFWVFGWVMSWRRGISIWGGFGDQEVVTEGSGRSGWWRGEGQGLQQIIPRGEDQVDGDGGKAAEELHARTGLRPGKLPQGLGLIADRVEGEGEQIEGDQQSGQVLLAVAEVVLEVVAIGFENVEGLVLNFPSGTAAGCEFRHVVGIDR